MEKFIKSILWGILFVFSVFTAATFIAIAMLLLMAIVSMLLGHCPFTLDMFWVSVTCEIP